MLKINLSRTSGKVFSLLFNFKFLFVVLFGVVIVSLLSSVSYAKTYGRLRVKVVMKDTGKPVKGLGVTVFCIENNKEYHAKTNEKGIAVFEKLIPRKGKWDYEVFAGLINIKGSILAYVPERYRNYVKIEEGKEVYIEIKMILGGVLTGRLLIKEEDGSIKPLAERFIYCVGENTGSMLHETKKDGKFWCIGNEGEYFITLDRDFIRKGIYYFKYFATRVKVKSGEIKDLGDIIAYDFTDKTGIEGYVYSKETGKPIEGAHIVISKKVERVKGSIVKLDFIKIGTDKNGYYRAAPLPEGVYNIWIDVWDYIENKKGKDLEDEEYKKYYLVIKKVEVRKGKLKRLDIRIRTK